MSTSTNHPVVTACAENRASQRREFTIAAAIEEAKWLRRTPDGIIAPELAKRTITTLLAAIERSTCYLNAVQRGQEVFVLVQQDRAAVPAIQRWATTAGNHGCSLEKVNEAFRTAERWEKQDPAATKWPD